MKITASIVLYRNAPEVFNEAIRSIIDSDTDVLLWVVDNSPEPSASPLFAHRQVRYHHAGANLGFGAGHNLAFALAQTACRSLVHFVVNPDVSFGPTVLGTLAQVFKRTPEISAAMPSIHDANDRLQHLCKALPTPLHLIARRFAPLTVIRRKIDADYEFRQLPGRGLVDIPNLSGCFLGIRSATFARIGGFDERFFMYMEDVDLIRRLGDYGRTVFVPEAKIRHDHARSSYRFGRLMFVHISSALRYFGKWGWFHDPIRSARNTAARQSLHPG